MGSKVMMGLMWCFVLLTILSCICEGMWLGNTESQAINWLTKYTTKGFSWFAVPVVFGSFLKDGVPALLSWDYSFFHNSWGGIVRLILSATLSVGLVWAFFTLMVPVVGSVVASVFGALRR